MSTTYKTHKASRKFLLCAVLFVFLTFPQATHEFDLNKFGGGSDDNDDDDGASKPMAKSRVAAKKFKFRKIERVYVAGDKEIDDDANDNDDNDDSRAADSVRRNEDEEFQFERARKARKESEQVKTPKQRSEQSEESVKTRKKSKQKKQKFDDDDDDDGNGDSDEAQQTTFFGRFFGGFFASESADKADKSEEETDKTNGIIDWLKWLGEKTGKVQPKPKPEPEPSSSETWLSYIDRWPFNSIFPIGKPEKPIRVPHASSNKRRRDKAEDDAEQTAKTAQPMSQEHFESLLHTLPGFVVNASHVADIECRQQMQLFHRQLRGNKLWTLQMLDATGKITSGLLRGNINQFGDFELCTQVKTVVKVTADTPVRIRGKYCLAHIEAQTDVPELKVPLHLAHGRGLWNSHIGNPSHFAPRYSVAKWGICIPHACSGEVVQEMIETNLQPYNTTGVEFHVEVNDADDCFMRQSKKLTKLLKKDDKFSAALLCISGLTLLTLLSLVYEHWATAAEFLKSKLKSFKGDSTAEENDTETVTESVVEAEAEEEAEVSADQNAENEITTVAESPEITAQTAENSLVVLAKEIFTAFSPTRTLAVLLSTESLDIEFPILHVLKLLATLMLYVCLKYLMFGHLPITNRDKLVRAVDQPFSILFRAPVIYADVLLLISGFIAAYKLSVEMEQKSFIQLLKRFALKIARYLPTLYVVLLFQTWILPHLGSGPLWSNLIGHNARLCEQQMWRNVFHVQNAIDFEETCSPMTIQLALEVQLYLLGPLIVWLYYTDSDAGFFVYGAIQAMSVAARFSRTNREHLSVTLFHGINVSKFYRTANILYASPISRATPYLIGIGAGLLYRSEGGALDIAPELVPFGWILAVLGIFWCFWAPSSSVRSDFIYTANDAASYASWSPLILGLALFWIIFMFPKKENSMLNILTSTRPVLLLSRIVFPMQLVMYVVVVYNTAIVKETLTYQLKDLVSLNEIGVIILLATLLAFIIDIPSQRIRHLLINRLFAERAQQEQTENEGVEDETTKEESEEKAVEEKVMVEEEKATIEEDNQKEDSHKEAQKEKEKVTSEDEKEEEEEEEEEEETDITEEEEVRKRPKTPTPPPVEEVKPAFTRRRRPTSDD